MIHFMQNSNGIDLAILKIQEKLHNRFNNQVDAYGRVSIIDLKGKKVPCRLVNNEYKEIILSGNNSVFFFIENEKSVKKDSYYQSDIDIHFLLNLDKLKPNLPDGHDEEIRLEIISILKRIRLFDLTEITRGKTNDFHSELIDMKPYHFLKFSGSLKFNTNCN